MKAMKNATVILVLAASFPVIGGLLHILCIIGGVSWYEFFLAPTFVIESAKAGTWLAPIATLIVAFLFLLAGGYGLSAAGILFRLPLLKPALISLALLFTVRGALLFYLIGWQPEIIDASHVIS